MKRFAVFILFLIASLFSCSNKGTINKKGELPFINIKDNMTYRKNEVSILQFHVYLTTPFDKVVKVNYTTIDGTAKSGTDYTSKIGSLTFSPGETKSSIDVPIPGGIRQNNTTQYLFVKLSDPVNCQLSKSQAKGTIINELSHSKKSGYTTPEKYPGYKLGWHDEFNEDKLSDDVWNYEIGNGGNGWGNHELEYYTSRSTNVHLKKGNLVIIAKKERYKGYQYTSARITTQGKKQFTYGRVDIRAKLPVAQGMWPALWMLGSNITSVGWPQCGETDIMELIGKKPKRVVGSFHWEKADGNEATVNNTHSLSKEDFSDHFHVFSLIWQKDSMKILVDDIPYVKASHQDLTDGIYPFDKPFFFILNVAVGGDWPGPPDHSTPFPQKMHVDYIRVFKKI